MITSMGLSSVIQNVTLRSLVRGTASLTASTERGVPPEVLADLEARYGFDKPLPAQLFTYVGNLLHGDLGLSQYSQKEGCSVQRSGAVGGVCKRFGDAIPPLPRH